MISRNVSGNHKLSLFIWELLRANRKERNKGKSEWVLKTQLSVILQSQLQSFNVAINKSFRTLMREEWNSREILVWRRLNNGKKNKNAYPDLHVAEEFVGEKRRDSVFEVMRYQERNGWDRGWLSLWSYYWVQSWTMRSNFKKKSFILLLNSMHKSHSK